MASPSHYETLFVARQPVLDEALNTWGYFHYYRRCQEHTYSEFSDPLQATLSVIQCLPACMDTCAQPHKALIHLPPQALMTGIPKALGAACVMPVLDPYPADDARYLDSLRTLKAEGYHLALDLARPFDLKNPLLEVAGTVILDMRAPEALNGELKSTVAELKRRGHILLAKRVETHEAADMARDLGFSLFAGHFFREPVTLTQRKISAAESTRLTLLDLLSRSEPPTDLLVNAIEADASVSYRVLTMLNSAHFGLLKKVSSVRQAVVMAGWMQLSAWLRVMVMGDVTPSTKARELLHLSAQRAKFFELLALASDRRAEADSLFLLGLFSLLPAMLDMPMATVLDKLSLDDGLYAGLCGEPGPYASWLAMAQAIEDTRWDDMAECALNLGLPTGSVATAYNASFQWADTLLLALPHNHKNGHGGRSEG
ncbi:MAG TPA: HDOD domain-containing protein [Humidesulfovibrio sp.]|uniref:EAL and HDOD domain-containing protein n=1 Tax=Humidesulfovibrio sp. TaxID=2910988 RepID=UPI002BE1B5F1|nr:HDOD domain-containing protein [Humidesulfovibrio sp.]HWR02812.1 HDOD domain-containing protein [Humidesulfovibrio sp.]